MTNSLTFEQLQRQLKALLAAGVIDQATFDRRLATAERATAMQTAQRNAGSDGFRPGRARSDRPRSDNSHVISAPYRFVPLADGWVAVDPETVHPLNEPADDGWEAEISIEIEAESPLLIGESPPNGAKGTQPGDVVPMSLHDRQEGHDWVIPGSTLRGWLRSEMEIVAFARLEQFNRTRSFGLRDFDHRNFGVGAYPVGTVSAVGAGWLRRIPDARHALLTKAAAADRREPPARYEIAFCPHWFVVDAGALARAMNLRPGEDFTRFGLLQKYDLADMTEPRGKDGKARIVDLEATLRRSIVEMVGDGEINDKSALTPKTRTNAGRPNGPRGHFVFSGKAPSGKGLEYWFDASTWTSEKGWDAYEWYPLTAAQWRRFEDINATIVGDTRKPQGNWKELKPTIDMGRPVPIFYVGDRAVPDRDVAPGQPRFAFGLTRLFKVPHEYDLGDVVRRSNHGRTDLLDEAERGYSSRVRVDFVENLFGYVHEPDDFGLSGPQAEAAPPRDFARRGRLAVGTARLVDGCAARTLPATQTVMSAAKPSFAPFYLVGPIKDYSDGNAKIAGRKVYPPRFDAAAVDAGQTVAEVERLLKRQVEAIQRAAAPGKTVSDATLSRLAFLDPGRKGEHPKFRSRLRLHNVTTAEIGAVLWVLTHGGRPNLRHMIGRAKGFGAGQVRVSVTALDVEALVPTAEVARPALGGGLEQDIAAFRAVFEDFMETEVKRMRGKPIAAWLSSPTVQGWLALRDPAKGARLAQEKRLDTMPLKQFEAGGGSFNPYKLIRDMTKPLKDGKPPIGPNAFLDIPKG